MFPKVRGENTEENAAHLRSLYSTSFEVKARLAFLWRPSTTLAYIPRSSTRSDRDPDGFENRYPAPRCACMRFS